MRTPEGVVVAVRDNVGEAVVHDHLVAPEDSRVRQPSEGAQLELGVSCEPVVQAVEPNLLHSESGMTLDGVNRAERAAPEPVLHEPEQLAGSEGGRAVASATHSMCFKDMLCDWIGWAAGSAGRDERRAYCSSEQCSMGLTWEPSAPQGWDGPRLR